MRNGAWRRLWRDWYRQVVNHRVGDALHRYAHRRRHLLPRQQLLLRHLLLLMVLLLLLLLLLMMVLLLMVAVMLLELRNRRQRGRWTR